MNPKSRCFSIVRFALRNCQKECHHTHTPTPSLGGRIKVFKCGVNDITQTLFIWILRDINTRLSDMAADEDEGRCRFHCRTNKEAYLAGVLKGVEMAFNLEAPTPEEAWDNWKKREQT